MTTRHVREFVLLSLILVQTAAMLGEFHASAAPPIVKTVSGDLLEYLEVLEARVLQKGDGRYVVPDGEVRSRVKAVVRQLGYATQGDSTAVQIAAEQANATGFEIVRFEDRSLKAYYYILKEKDSQNRGWGYYVFAVTHVDVVLEAPHPLADSNTSRIAAEIFVRSKSRVLLVAGAHRDAVPKDAADVSHQWDSVFEAVHEETIRQNTVIIQMHSFSRIRKVYTGYPDIVLSSGTEAISGIMESVAANLRQEGFRVGLYDGFSWTRLSARSNVQGIFSRRVGAQFIHVEIEFRIVESASFSARVVGAIGRSIESLFKFPLDVNWRIPFAVAFVVGLIGIRSVADRALKRRRDNGR